MWTNAYGATSSSTTIAARGFRRRFRPLTESPQVVNTNSSPSSANHTGITCGRPPGPLVATLAVRVPWLRKARISSAVILRGILASSCPVYLVAFWRRRPLDGARRGLQLEHQVGAEDRGCGGEALSGRREPAQDALEGRVPVTGHGFRSSRVAAKGQVRRRMAGVQRWGAGPPLSPLRRLPPSAALPRGSRSPAAQRG